MVTAAVLEVLEVLEELMVTVAVLEVTNGNCCSTWSN